MAARRTDGWLRSLTVEGFGLIDRTAVELRPGFNAFTGESGSGKSMVIDALGFAFGARAGADVVRAGSAKASVFAEVEPSADARRWLRDNGYDGEDQHALIVSRDMQAQGRSGGRINGKPATAAQLRELGDLLLDIVGQHEHTQLAHASRHIDLLDGFAGDEVRALCAKVGSLYERARELRAEIDRLRASEAAAARAIADAKYASEEIAAARLRPGEIEELRERRTLLANAAKIAGALRAATEDLDAADSGATVSLGRATAALGQVAAFGERLRELSEAAKGLQGAAQDLSQSIASLADDETLDPAALESVEDRLAAIERLQKKYGPTIEEILASGEQFESVARELENRGEAIERLATALRATNDELDRDARALSTMRKEAAAALGKRVEGELTELGIRGASFRCGVEDRTDGIGPKGLDRVEFFATLNPKEPERPIAKAASGGELSRLLLALKVALADVDPHPIVVLDEIDAGIGGAAARSVGARIAALANSVQVLCVTHLAQIAAFADEHVTLDKTMSKGRVTIEARVLEGRDETRTEIARMLAGDAKGAEALRHAEALMKEIKR